MANVSSFELAKKASHGSCEAMIKLSVTPNTPTWTRCGLLPIEVHHRLPRSRGGVLLDDAQETYHLMCLCRKHHKDAHERTDSFTTGLMIEGFVINDVDGKPSYTGPDPYLAKRWGPHGDSTLR